MPHDDYEYVTVHSSAMTNTTHGSKVELLLAVDGPPICDNMTDAEFRKKVLTLRDDAVTIITNLRARCLERTCAGKSQGMVRDRR